MTKRKRNKKGTHRPISRVKGTLTAAEAKELKACDRWVQSQGLHMPKSRAECVNGERPCPWVRCRYHAFLEVMWDGTVKLNWPGREVWEIPETCTLDVSANSGQTLEEIGAILNITRERVRQVEKRALAKLQSRDLPNLLRGQLAE